MSQQVENRAETEGEQEPFRPDAPQPALIRLPIRTPFEVGDVNVYLSIEPQLTLIDTGPLTDDAWDDLQKGLAANGVAGSDIKRIILTHGHVDHFGLAARIKAASGAEIWAHRSMARWTTDFTAEWQRRLAFLSLLCTQHGVPAGEMPAINRGTKKLGSYAEPVAIDRLLDDGDEIELAGAEWQVIHTPGHATTHICLHQPAMRALLAGDHVLPDISSNPVLEAPPFGESQRPRMLPLYIAALKRVAELQVLWLYPGHREPFQGHRKLIKSRLEKHEGRAAKLLGFLEEGDQSCYALSRRLFPALEGVNLFLGISETLGHLDLLEDRQQVTLRPDGRGLVYGK